MITVIAGCMFSRKTTTLLHHIAEAKETGRLVYAFKPLLDTRYNASAIVSHDGQETSAYPIQNAYKMLPLVNRNKGALVAVDEAQFFDLSLIDVVNKTREYGFDMVLAGLDLDFRGECFGIMGELLALADVVVKRQALCAICGNIATRTQRLINEQPAPRSSPLVLVGGEESYQARCIHCHDVPD